MSNFAHTTHSLRLIERLAVSIQISEPVLLVGETGTGKTTAIQYLADLMGQTLTVLVVYPIFDISIQFRT